MADGRIAPQEAHGGSVESRETLAHVLMPQREVQRLTEALAAKDDVIRGLTAALRSKDEEIRRLVGRGDLALDDRCGARCRCIRGRPCGKPKGHKGPHETHFNAGEVHHG